MTKINNSLSKELPLLQIAWDSTSLGLFKSCPRKYQYTILENYRRKQTAPALEFGILFHRAMEIFEKYIRKEEYDQALTNTVKDIMQESRDINKEAWETHDNKRNITTLIRAIIWYFEHWRNSNIHTVELSNGKPATELHFKFELGQESITGEEFTLCGHIDKVVRHEDNNYIMDYKTSVSALDQKFYDNFTPDNQMSLYPLAGNVCFGIKTKGVIIDGIQLGVGFTRFGRGFIKRSSCQLEEFLNDARFWIRQAEICAEENHFPMNDTSCGDYGKCPFRDVCSKSVKTRKYILKSDFRKEVWDCTEER